MKILLAVGHGLKSDGTQDPGALSADKRWSEQTAGDYIVAEAAKELREWGAEVRDEAFKADPNYPGSVMAANAWPADYAVEVHHDYNLASVGAFGHWYRDDSKAFADSIQASVGAAGFPLRPSWHKWRGDLTFIKATRMPSVLYECGRIGQSTLDTPEELRAMGRAIARGIALHVGLQLEPTEEDDMTPEQDQRLRTVEAAVAALQKSAKASSFRESIAIAVAVGDFDAADRLYSEAQANGFVTGYRRP